MRLPAACCWAPAANEAVAASSPMEAAVVRLAVVVCVVTAVVDAAAEAGAVMVGTLRDVVCIGAAG